MSTITIHNPCSRAPDMSAVVAHFLLGQQLRKLTETDPERVRALVCRIESPTMSEEGRDKPDEHWQVISRDEVVRRARAVKGGERFGLVCDAGLGKSFNMRWLFDQLCDRKYRPRIPFMLRLDESHDLKLVVNACNDPDVLLNRFVDQVHLVTKCPKPQLHRELDRKRKNGQITLLFDGLDHALAAPEFASQFAELLTSEHWKHCPVWVSGRPYAFNEAWRDVFGRCPEQWQFFQVERFGEREIRDYMQLHTVGDWYDSFPPRGLWLLSIPRLLVIVCNTLLSAFKRNRGRDRAEVVNRLNLNTPADVYHRAYFELGEYSESETYGLIAQGNKGVVGKDSTRRYIGLEEGVELNEFNFEDCVTRTAEVIGEIAFHMFNANADADAPEPNTSGLPFKQLRKAIADRLKADADREGKIALFDRDMELLKHTNAHHLDFLILAESDEKAWRFQDRSVEAFFAAHWALTNSTSEDRVRMQKWIIDREGKPLGGFDEFWQFAAELLPVRDPKAKTQSDRFDPERWLEVFKPCFVAPPILTSSENWMEWQSRSGVTCASGTSPQHWIQWHRRMIYHTVGAMQDRFLETVRRWWPSVEQLGEPKNQMLSSFLSDGQFCRIPAGTCHFRADPVYGKPGTPIQVGAFRLHQYPVTNEIYELFDPAHKVDRWGNELHPTVNDRHPAVKENGNSNADNTCPVVNVTWFDAWCFAVWCGCRLPTEQQWEHACRAGTAYRYSYGNNEDEFADHAWFNANSQGRTHPVGERPIATKPHRYGLFDMHGNVSEWCDSWLDGGFRVLVGGSWGDFPEGCTVAVRSILVPRRWIQFRGFRVCLPEPT